MIEGVLKAVGGVANGMVNRHIVSHAQEVGTHAGCRTL
jgi:hypothetical protein